MTSSQAKRFFGYRTRTKIMSTSINFNGKCEKRGKKDPPVTVAVHIRDPPGTVGTEEWCLECIQGKGSEINEH